nr:saccharopine dehydrogenase [Gemmatimonadota bacterium]NIQ57627.1 saccharopine dehydrogenase [Gemmatimonadota bacterium]NIU77794.1 saccharopine dehydrogenase [Gammaproteobacteria bacterium]NIX46926.1 saccharopine dehydrogenase [Gemmatimonadota bacterium]NIY11275.1 saccharopine dehydrogenase [Gemmatimonadota bacterium]
ADAEGPVRHAYHLIDRFDSASGLASMARTTGYTATALARLVLSGRYRVPGISPPEAVGATDGALAFVLDHLRERRVRIDHTAERG